MNTAPNFFYENYNVGELYEAKSHKDEEKSKIPISLVPFEITEDALSPWQTIRFLNTLILK
jgi:hypothetical protein